MLRARLLSRPHVGLTNDPSSTPLVGKGLALFAYVAIREEACLRSKLVDLLWADVPERKAQEYLRSLLYSVRQSIGDYLVVSRQTVELNRALPYWLDVEIFAGSWNVRVKQDALLLTEALNLYQCEFLDGLQVSNAPVFDAWLEEERSRLRDHAIAGWQKLTDYYWSQQDYQEGITANARLLALAPWQEEAHRRQMHFLAATGQRSAALAQYELCCRYLSEELDAPPSKATTALYEQLKAPAGVPADQRYSALPQANAQPAKTTEPAPLMRLSLGTMPRPHWFVGRQQEMQTLHRWLIGERCRAVSILGTGGQGKTTLAASFVQMLAEQAQNAQPAFEGIVWHTVHYAPQPEAIIYDWLRLLTDEQFVLPATRDRQIDLLREHLQHRRFLFVLDNAESILEAMDNGRHEEYSVYVQLWRLFVESNHQCCLLVTSRVWMAQLRNQYEQQGSYRRLILEGLRPEDSVKLLKQHGLYGDEQEFASLQQFYCGNPLALELVAHTIDDLFDGQVTTYLAEDLPLLGEVGAILNREFTNLSPLEQELLTWLSLAQQPVSSAQLWNGLLSRPTKSEYLAALNRLLQCTLLRKQDANGFHVEGVLGEYARHRVLDEIYLEVASNPPLHPVYSLNLNRYRLYDLPTDPDPVHRCDRPLAALIKRFLHHPGREQVMKNMDYLLAALDSEQDRGTPFSTGYGRDNLLHLQAEIMSEASIQPILAH